MEVPGKGGLFLFSGGFACRPISAGSGKAKTFIQFQESRKQPWQVKELSSGNMSDKYGMQWWTGIIQNFLLRTLWKKNPMKFSPRGRLV